MGNHRGADVEGRDAETGVGQANAVQPRSTGGVEEVSRRLGEQSEQAAQVPVDHADTPAGAVVILVEVLAKKATADHGVAPVQLDAWVESTWPRLESGWPRHRRQPTERARRERVPAPQNARQ